MTTQETGLLVRTTASFPTMDTIIYSSDFLGFHESDLDGWFFEEELDMIDDLERALTDLFRVEGLESFSFDASTIRLRHAFIISK